MNVDWIGNLWSKGGETNLVEFLCLCPIFFQPRYLLTSLALNDLAIGILITPFGMISALFHCWAFGEVVCQIQASALVAKVKLD